MLIEVCATTRWTFGVFERTLAIIALIQLPKIELQSFGAPSTIRTRYEHPSCFAVSASYIISNFQGFHMVLCFEAFGADCVNNIFPTSWTDEF